MSGRPTSSRPSFLWTGMFILLPIVALALASLISLKQDEQTAENEARQRAAANAESLGRAMRASVNEELQRYLTLQNMWSQEMSSESQPSVTFPSGFPSEKLSADIAKWERDYPRFKLADMALPQAEILADGRQIEPPDFPIAPQPPRWFVDLTPEQKRLWESARAAHSNTERQIFSNAFHDSVKSESARKAWDLLVQSPENIAGNSEGNFPTETGVSFEEIACAQLLTAPSAQLTEALLQCVWWRVFDRPSILSPRLLELTGALTNTADVRLQQKFVWMQKYFAKQNKVRSQLASLRQLQELQPWKKLWWSHWTADGSALAIFQPMTITNSGNDYTGTSPSGNGYQVWFVPADVMTTILIRAAEENKYLIPAYVSAQFVIEGVQIPPLTPTPVLAENSLLGSTKQKAGDALAQNAAAYEVKFYLTSREQMLSAEHRRTKIFGGLVLGAVFTALIGFFAAYRSFRKERQLNTQKTNFVSSVSHELRAPIASVRLMAENLERGKVSEPTKQSEYFRFIGQECRRLSSLIENVLDFSRIEQGRKQYEFEPTDLVALTQNTLKLMEPYAAEKGVMFELDSSHEQMESKKTELEVDGRAIQQALVNLIDNAIKHSAKGQTVLVGIEREEAVPAVVKIFVSDQGPGIPRAEHERIFERFYRRGSELRRETQGIGIGLSIVKHIVETHGGHVTVESEPDQGSRFTIVLPEHR